MSEQATWTGKVLVSANTRHVGPTEGPWTVSMETLKGMEEQTRGVGDREPS